MKFKMDSRVLPVSLRVPHWSSACIIDEEQGIIRNGIWIHATCDESVIRKPPVLLIHGHPFLHLGRKPYVGKDYGHEKPWRPNFYGREKEQDKRDHYSFRKRLVSTGLRKIIRPYPATDYNLGPLGTSTLTDCVQS
jgi:hypothetical protein